MTKTELESKHLAELHALAAETGVPRYRMLPREELIEKLAGGDAPAEKPRESRKARPRRERKPRESRERSESSRRREPRERRERPKREEPKQPAAEPTSEKSREAPAAAESAASEPAAGERAPEERRPRRRRRRRFGRKRKDLRLLDLATAGDSGRQTIVYAETREGCTGLLRELAAEISGESNGSDPIALLVDPGPEELADWRREAPDAEIVAAAQARHADDAIAQAVRRAQGGESVVVLIDSLTRLVELGDVDAATDLLGAAAGVTVVAALEHG